MDAVTGAGREGTRASPPGAGPLVRGRRSVHFEHSGVERWCVAGSGERLAARGYELTLVRSWLWVTDEAEPVAAT